MTRLASTLLLSSVLALAACEGGGGDGDDDTDGSGTPDAGPGMDAACEAATALPLQFRPIAVVSTGAIMATAAGGVTTASIDATAGGLQGAADNPYVYLSFATGGKVEIHDVAAFGSSEWDVAFKRASIKLNGGDSGPGGLSVAVVAAGTLAEVTAAPADNAFQTDDWADEMCQLIALPSGEPLTAFGEWYAYDEMTHVVTPHAQVFVIKKPDGKTYKLRVITYYGDQAMPMRGGFYQVEWAEL